MLANNRMLTFKFLKKTRIPAIVLFTPIGLHLFPNSAVKRSTDNTISTVVCCNWCSQMKPALAELQQPPIAYIWRQIRIHLFTHYFSFLTFQLWFELFVEWRLICVGYCHGSQCCWLFCRCIDLILQEGFNGEGGSFQLIGMCKAATVSVSGASFLFSRYGKYGMLALFGRGRSNSAESISRCSRERCRALSCWATSVYAHSWCVSEWLFVIWCVCPQWATSPVLKRRKMRKYACQSHGFKLIISGTMLEYSRWNWKALFFMW